MSILCVPASSLSSSTTTQPYIACATKSSIASNPFIVGFSLLKSKQCVQTVFPVTSSRNFVVRSQKNEEKDLACVPLDQRWMFEESELNGPVILNPHRSFIFLYLGFFHLLFFFSIELSFAPVLAHFVLGKN